MDEFRSRIAALFGMVDPTDEQLFERIRDSFPAESSQVPVAIQRLMDEVRLGDGTPHGLFDRAHNRHNR